MGNHGLSQNRSVNLSIRLKRARAVPDAADGFRVLVDRLWPRGLSRTQLKIDAWAKDLAPSTPLRQWFNHEADKWPEFRERYFTELASRQEQLNQLISQAENQQITLIYAARDDRYNNAVALKEYLEQGLLPRS
jgi:uncharacterized protein YeaO (DUF488 family)